MNGACVLVVEDEALVGMEIAESLGRMGFSVPAVIDEGEKVLDAVVKYRPDLILMDIRLRGLQDGVETAFLVGSEYDIPIVYLTAFSDEDTIARVKVTKAYGYLVKPFDDRTLKVTLEIALARAGKERGGGAEFSREQSYDDVLSSLPEPVFIVDQAARIRYANPRALQVLGDSSLAEVKEKPLQVFFGTDFQLPWALFDPNFAKGDGLSGFLSPMVTLKDVQYALSVLPLRSDDGVLWGIMLRLESAGLDSRERIQLEVEAKSAAQLVKSFFPKRGSILSGWLVDGFANSGPFGAGDLFVVHPITSNQAFFFIVDVMGSGYRATLLAETIYDALLDEDGLALEDFGEGPLCARPSELLSRLNDRFRMGGYAPAFFTMICGFADSESGVVLLARAGHPLPMISKPGLAASIVNSSGSAVGVFPESEWELVSLKLDHGDRLALYTDGAIELMNSEREQFGMESLSKSFSVRTADPASVAVDGVLSDLKAWRAHTPVMGDVMFWVLERT